MKASLFRYPTVAVSAAIALLTVSCLVGCAANPAPILVKPAPVGPAVLVIGEIAAEDPEARRLARHLRVALIDRLVRAETFSVVYDRGRPHVDGPVLMLVGEILEADRGSDAWRFILGSGIGRPRLAASFDVTDPTGAVRVAFAVESDDPGPSGLAGHWSPLSMDELARDVGRSTADAIIRWRRGETIAAATWFQQ